MAGSEEKDTLKRRVNIFIIANALVWGAVIIGTSLVLRGTEYMSKLIPIFCGGAFISVILLSGGLLRRK